MSKLLFCIFVNFMLFQLLDAQNYRIAVSELDAKGVTISEAAIVTDFLRNDLFTTGKFEVLERAKMKEILEEIAFQQTGCTTAECAVEMGKILNVEKMIVGSLSRLGNTYYVSIRFVDVATGKVEFADRVSCKCPIDILPTTITDLANRIANNVYSKSKTESQIRDLSVTEGVGVLYVKTEPPNAEVFIDGILKGTTPYVDTNIPSGNYFIKIKWKDGKEEEQFISLEPNEVKRLEYKSDETVNYNANKMTILSDPLEADVYMDGSYIGKTPIIKENINPGKHDMLFLKENKYDCLEFEIERNQTQTIRANLVYDLDLNKLKINLISDEAKIFLNGILIKTVSNRKNISLGELFNIKDILEQSFPFDKTILTIINGSKIALYSLRELMFILKNESSYSNPIEPKDFIITINPISDNDYIYFNGIKIGQGVISFDANALIKNKKLFLFNKNIIFCKRNKDYYYTEKSLNIKKAGHAKIDFANLELSTVNFKIQPRPFVLLINSSARLYDVHKLYIQPGEYDFLLAPANPSLKNKIYKLAYKIKELDVYDIEYDFNK